MVTVCPGHSIYQQITNVSLWKEKENKQSAFRKVFFKVNKNLLPLRLKCEESVQSLWLHTGLGVGRICSIIWLAEPGTGISPGLLLPRPGSLGCGTGKSVLGGPAGAWDEGQAGQHRSAALPTAPALPHLHPGTETPRYLPACMVPPGGTQKSRNGQAEIGRQGGNWTVLRDLENGSQDQSKAPGKASLLYPWPRRPVRGAFQTTVPAAERPPNQKDFLPLGCLQWHQAAPGCALALTQLPQLERLPISSLCLLLKCSLSHF